MIWAIVAQSFIIVALCVWAYRLGRRIGTLTHEAILMRQVEETQKRITLALINALHRANKFREVDAEIKQGVTDLDAKTLNGVFDYLTGKLPENPVTSTDSNPKRLDTARLYPKSRGSN